MSTFAENISAQLQAIERSGLYRTRQQTASACAPVVRVRGEDLLAFNSNDYLGLANDERIIEAFKEGLSLYGAGSGASHLISGHSQAHTRLENKLAKLLSPYIEQAGALYFCTGYMANLAVMTSLVDSVKGGAEIFSEERNHASIIDAVRLSRAAFSVYPHCDTQALSKLLSKSSAKLKVVVTDGVFSMDGDLAPLKELARICESEDAILVVDDAHGFGVLGESGKGMLEHYAVSSPQIIYMGTLGKAAGVSGAFVCANSVFIDWMIQRARPYIYTTAAPPACAHALLRSVDLITGSEGVSKRKHLQELIHLFKLGVGEQFKLDAKGDVLKNREYRLLDSSTPIQPLIIGSNEDVLRASQTLFEEGLWVTAIRAPTVPVGSARLRITMSATHTAQHVERLLSVLKKI
jgi:8-amino-7-oxononanoate synthase